MTSTLLVTGGAGFVGSWVATHFAQRGWVVTALDNLRRRGSEVTVRRLDAAGVRFVHGDVRVREDVEAAGSFDVLIDCAAEPSVHAGAQGDPAYVVATNLMGTTTCLEAARRVGAGVIFLSSSRVYPVAPLRSLPLVPAATRLTLPNGACGQGWSSLGIAEGFPLSGHRTLYGATKLASELLIEEYRQMYGMPAIINRCGVIAGPWQMGRVDQGFVSLWAARHLWGDGLSYTGFGGTGLQVRDVLHPLDLCALLEIQVRRLSDWSGAVFNVGGGVGMSLSLLELTALCEARSHRRIRIDAVAETSAADVPYYVTDHRAVMARCDWSPERSVDRLLDDVFAWLRADEVRLRPILA